MAGCCSSFLGAVLVLAYGWLSWMQYRSLLDNHGPAAADANVYEWHPADTLSDGCKLLFNTLRVSCLCISYVLIGFCLALLGSMIFSVGNIVLFKGRELSAPLVRNLTLAVASLKVIWGLVVLLPNLAGLLEVVMERGWHLQHLSWTCAKCTSCQGIYDTARWTFGPLALLGLFSTVGGLQTFHRLHVAHTASLMVKADKAYMAPNEFSALMPPRY
eukprot:TRINITY_DN105155_c0_g1_i1.p1 TRINITY_DN105155_c0_g1~~TRINITY_DN105155_c0_g1_i1.p1  ORF type:complete len:216 (+),score=36.08 TRINITY_DN105155_c0_g1_i1:127-774(+)